MGLKAYEEILAVLRKAAECGFWPKVIEDTSTPSGFRFEWPDGLNFRSVMIEDLSGRIRGLVFTVTGENANSLSQRQWGSSSSEELEEVQEALTKPSILKRILFEMYANHFRSRGVTTMYIVFDQLNRTPPVKRILQDDKPVIPIQWPVGHDRSTLFTGDHPFRNSVHEYVVDKEAKPLLWDYLGTALVDEFAAEHLPEGCELIVWGAVYKGVDMAVPYIISKSLDGVVTCQPMQPTEEVPRFMCVEADVAIVYLVKAYLGKRNVVVTSRDNDFIPALLSVYSQALREHATFKKTEPNPLEYGVFLLRKVIAKAKIHKSQVSEETLAKMASQKKTQKTLDSSSSPAAPASTSTPDGEDAGEDDPLDWFKESNGDSSPKTNGKAAGVESDMVEVKGRVVEVIDIGEVFKVIWYVFSNAHRSCKSNCDPMDVFALICFMSGSDYYKKLPGISWNKLCATYLDYDNNRRIGCMCPRDNCASGINYYRLNYDAFTRFIALAYSKALKPSDLNDRANYGAVRSFLKKKTDDAKAKRKTVPKVQREATVPPDAPHALSARAAWVLNYYTRSWQPGWVFTKGTEVDPETGESLYGYSPSTATPKGYDLAEKVEGKKVVLRKIY